MSKIDLKAFADEILADGVIDEQEVARIKEVILEDGVIDKEEAEFLFSLNDAVSGKANCPQWKDLMVDSIVNYLLDDEKSPGSVDDEEGKWLVSMVEGDGKLDDVEKAVLLALSEKASSISPELKSKLDSLVQ